MRLDSPSTAKSLSTYEMPVDSKASAPTSTSAPAFPRTRLFLKVIATLAFITAITLVYLALFTSTPLPATPTSSHDNSAPLVHTQVDINELPICGDFTARPGTWQTVQGLPSPLYPTRFVPYDCQYFVFGPQEARECLNNRKIVFAGDSLLRNVATEILKIVGDGLGTGWNGFKKGMVDTQQEVFQHPSFNLTVNFFWNPSTFYPVYEPHHQKDWDTYILSHAVWDMFTYNSGPRRYEESLRRFLYATEQNTKNRGKGGSSSGLTPKWGWFTLHALHPSKCQIRPDGTYHPGCKYCQGIDRAIIYRNIGRNVAMCASLDTTKDNKNLISGLTNQISSSSRDIDWLIDTFALTNTESASTDSPDGVHYDVTTTQMEAQMMMGWMCKDWVQDKYNAGKIKQPILKSASVTVKSGSGCSERFISEEEDKLDRKNFEICYKANKD
ncbi:hypothetical protein HDU76_013713 [Blyttiomyces sp. JEL0837]|nr:hypothetical protein HDU76_013713 [Blyttiomyces sp. JEL0837]